MSRVWFGNLDNRLMENKQFVDEIKVGDGCTFYSYSDRHAYEVIEVRDQKHVTVRELTAVKKEGAEWYQNSWELISDENNNTVELTKRGKYWYKTDTCTREYLEWCDSLEDEREKMHRKLNIALCGFDIDKIMEKGQQTKYRRENVSFGVADYYYDYEF